MAKIDLINEAAELGIPDVSDKLTVAELEKLIADKKAEAGDNGNPPPPPIPETQAPAAYVYPVFNLWKIDVENLTSEDDKKPKQVKFTAVKIIRPGVKLEKEAAERLNTQSHNNLERYYPVDIENGYEETVTIK